MKGGGGGGGSGGLGKHDIECNISKIFLQASSCSNSIVVSFIISTELKLISIEGVVSDFISKLVLK